MFKNLYRNLVSLFSVAVATTTFPHAGFADDYVIGLPNGLPRNAATQITDAVLDMSNELKFGDRLFVLEAGESPRLIISLEITEHNRSRRRREISMPMGQFSDYMSENYDNGANVEHETSHIMFPQLLAEIATQTLAATNPQDRTVCVLAIGTAKYYDEREPDFTMRNGYFPSDGWIIGSQSQSPYGTADRQGFLQGVNVHLAFTDTDWASDLHKLRIQRAWSLFTSAQNGVLSSFTPDITTAIERWKHCEIKAGRNFGYDSTRDVQAMLQWNRVPAPENETEIPIFPANELSANQQLLANDDWLRREDITGAVDRPTSLSGSFKLGIRWSDDQNCNVDMDLYTRSSPQFSYLFFNNKTTPDGRFNKDITATSQLGMSNGMEYVDLTDIDDVSTLQIMVNHYAGNCQGGVYGVVRAYFNGVVYEAPFHTTSEDGNRGRARSTAQESEYWAVISPRELFNLE